MKRLFITVLAAWALFLPSCSKNQEKTPPPQENEKSVFEELREKTQKNPNDADSWFYLADLYERSEMYREEAAALNKVIALKPSDGYLYIKLGTAYNRLGDYKEAIRNFTIAKKYFPKNAVLFNNMAVAYGKSGNLDEEIATLKHAISLRPHYSTARYNLGVTYLKKGKRELALEQYRELLQFDEGVAQALKQEIDGEGK